MEIGNSKIGTVSGGRFRLDGGAMFGVVPKPLWNRKSPADEQNRIQLDTNCLLIRSQDALVLCDTGYGTKLTDKELAHLGAVDSLSLGDNLLQKGIEPNEITHVIFSHLHFDHAGGATILTESTASLALMFPNAIHVIQQREKNDATGNALELTGNYYESELSFLFEHGNCSVIDGTDEILPSIRVVQTGGHTFGHQIIWVESDNLKGVYLGDICPTTAHLNVFWTMSYDAYQLEVRRQKIELLTQIAKDKSVIFFDHDPEIRAATISQKNETSFVVDQVFDIDSSTP